MAAVAVATSSLIVVVVSAWPDVASLVLPSLAVAALFLRVRHPIVPVKNPPSLAVFRTS